MATTYENGVYIGQMSPDEALFKDWLDATAQYEAQTQPDLKKDPWAKTVWTPQEKTALHDELFAPYQTGMQAMTGKYPPADRIVRAQSPDSEWDIVHTTDGIFRINKLTGEKQVVHETAPKPGLDAFQTVTEKIPAVDDVPAVPAQPASSGSPFGLGWWGAYPALPGKPGVPGHGEQSITKRVPVFTPGPPQPGGFIGNMDAQGQQSGTNAFSVASPGLQDQASFSNEEIHQLKNGRWAIFNPNTKQFLRYTTKP